MEEFTKLDCGCYVGFDVHHKPMWGKKCPKHNATDDLYEAFKGILLVAIPHGKTDSMVFEKEYFGKFDVLGNRLEKAVEALSKAEGK